MTRIGRNDPCPCGSGIKYKKCCLNKKPRQQAVMIGSPEPLRGFHYDKEKMELMGLTVDSRLIKPFTTFSQTHYKGESGKEKILSRIHDKVISGISDLLRHLSSFDLIVGVDTNTRTIESETVSATGVIHCIVHNLPEPDSYYVEFPWEGMILFRNCPKEISPEKYGWITAVEGAGLIKLSDNNFAIVTDHDLDNHALYNQRKAPVLGDSCLPLNFVLIYGRGDGATENILNYLVKHCDKKSTEVLNAIEANEYFQFGDIKLPIKQFPIPAL